MALPDWFLESARALIRADSVSAVGNGAALAVLEPLYARAGLPTRRFDWRESIDGAPDSLHTNLLAGPGGLESGAAWSSAKARAALSRGELPEAARGRASCSSRTATPYRPGPSIGGPRRAAIRAR